MGLDYSQKRLVSAPLRRKAGSKKAQRLQMYAFFTGLMSTLISLVHLVIIALQ